MWPFTRTVPDHGHESCARKIAELREDVEQLKLDSAERNLQVLEYTEKVAHALRERKRKRDQAEEPESPPPTFRSRRGF